jgi:hypothetical protein
MVHPRNTITSIDGSSWSKHSMRLKSGHKIPSPLYAALLCMAMIAPSLGQAHSTQIYGGTGCINAQDLETQLTEALNALAPQRTDTQNLRARVALSLSADNLSVSFKLMDTSAKVALSRRYQLHRQDCPDVPSLLQLVLEEFLREFPENPWRSEKPEKALTDKDLHQRQTTLRTGIALLSSVEPWGASLETNLHITGALQGPIQWLAGLHLRAALPQNALNGSYQKFEMMLSAGTTVYAWHTHWDLKVLGGLMILKGNSFQVDRTALAPNLEINLGARWNWNHFSAGPTLGVQVLKHSIQVLPSTARAHISIVNLGLTLQYDMI